MATFSTVLSSTTVSWARLITARISQRWGWPWTVGSVRAAPGSCSCPCSGEDVVMLYSV